MLIESELQLREIYGHAKGRAKDKQLVALEHHSINFIEHSPFMTLSTHAISGSLDCSPRGGEPGFVKVFNKTWAMFDRLVETVYNTSTGYINS
jgi:hypothetical protein